MFKPDIIQVPYNAFDQRIERSGWLNKLKENGVEVHARSIFLQGLLLMDPSNRPKYFSKWDPIFDRWEKYVENSGFTNITCALRHALDNPKIDRVLIGVQSEKELNDILVSLDLDIDITWNYDSDLSLSLIDPRRWDIRQNTVAIIQARMGSSRFLNKTLRPIADQPLIGFLIDRLKRCESLKNIIIATTVNKSDDQLFEWAKLHNVPLFRGSETDVLNRFFKCASQYDVDVIVRITADDPLKDPKVIDRAVTIFNSNDYDYVSNTINPTFPEGIDVEVFSFSALSRAEHEAKKESEREHVTPYIYGLILTFFQL